MTFTRSQYATAVQAAHDALHDAQEFTAEAQAMLADLRKMLAQLLPCGHTLADLIGGARMVTKCGACMAEKQAGTGRFAPEPEPPEAA